MGYVVTDMEKKIRDLINQYLPGCPFVWTNAVRQFGHCRFRNGKVVHIAISRPLAQLNEWSVVRNTVLHELAHALVGQGHGHDAVWKAKARELGCSDERCYNNGRDGISVVTPPSYFVVYCEKCKKDICGRNKGRMGEFIGTHRNCGGRCTLHLNTEKKTF